MQTAELRLGQFCCLRFLVFYERFDADIQIGAQLTDQCGVDTLKFIAAVAVEIRARNIKRFANLILGDTAFLQKVFDVKNQTSIFHENHLIIFFAGWKPKTSISSPISASCAG